jgi:hypothetical protein
LTFAMRLACSSFANWCHTSGTYLKRVCKFFEPY